MQVSIKDVKTEQWHQYNYLDTLAFIQASEGHNAVQQHKQRETLKPTYLYLDSMSSFDQVFSDKYLEEVKQVGITLHCK